MTQLRFKTELADGEIHMTAHEFVEHRTREDLEMHKTELRKLANNPILNKETQKLVRYAVYCVDDILWYREIISTLREQIDNMKKGGTK